MNPLIFSEFDRFLPVDIVHTNATLSSHSNAHVHSNPADNFCTCAELPVLLWCVMPSKYRIKFDYLCMVANTAFLQHWYEKICFNNEILLQQNFSASTYYWFKRASRNGQLSTLDFLAKQLNKAHLEKAFRSANFNAFYLAISNDHTNVLEFFAHHFRQTCLNAAFENNQFDAFHLASTKGHADILAFFERRFDKTRLEEAAKALVIYWSQR